MTWAVTLRLYEPAQATLLLNPSQKTVLDTGYPFCFASFSVSNPRHPITSHDASDSRTDWLSDSTVTFLPATDTVKTLSYVANGLPTRSFSHKRYLIFSTTNQFPLQSVCRKCFFQRLRGIRYQKTGIHWNPPSFTLEDNQKCSGCDNALLSQPAFCIKINQFYE